jgi:hypothetical protein
MPNEKMINPSGRHPKKASSSNQKGTPKTATSKGGTKPTTKRPSKQY